MTLIGFQVRVYQPGAFHGYGAHLCLYGPDPGPPIGTAEAEKLSVVGEVEVVDPLWQAVDHDPRPSIRFIPGAGGAGTRSGLRRRASPKTILTIRMAGYSGTPLARKLGIGTRTHLVLVNVPAALANKMTKADGDKGTSDVVVIFSTEASDLELRFLEAMEALPADGAIWCAWPKRASKVPTDITEDRLRDLFLPTGMVDNKVAAIDEVWSGLRFVVRKERRITWNT